MVGPSNHVQDYSTSLFKLLVGPTTFAIVRMIATTFPRFPQIITINKISETPPLIHPK